jgi:hypothetical protein
VAMSTNEKGYNPIRFIEKHGIFQPTNEAILSEF